MVWQIQILFKWIKWIEIFHFWYKNEIYFVIVEYIWSEIQYSSWSYKVEKSSFNNSSSVNGGRGFPYVYLGPAGGADLDFPNFGSWDDFSVEVVAAFFTGLLEIFSISVTFFSSTSFFSEFLILGD